MLWLIASTLAATLPMAGACGSDLPVLPPIEPIATTIPTSSNPVPVERGPSEPVRPRVSPAQWITTEFPGNPEHPEEGIVAYRLLIGRDGRPTACLIRQSSGSARLDQGTCAVLMRRARFWPATNAKAQPIEGEWSGTVRWVIPDEPLPTQPD